MAEPRLAITGSAGRMGLALARLAHQTGGVAVASATEARGHPSVGDDLGALAGLGPSGVIITDDPEQAFANVDAVLDFTTPSATVRHAEMTARRKLVHVIGTTGLSESDETAVRTASASATIIKAGNMSLGVTLLAQLIRKAAEALDTDFDIEVLDMHHRHKVDAPSGTAIMLGEAAAAGRGVALDGVAVRGRDGYTGERAPGAIGFAALRGGGGVGEHKVIFAADYERIELSHVAEDRSLFARGALKAALWGQGKPAGLYSMIDVLGL